MRFAFLFLLIYFSACNNHSNKFNDCVMKTIDMEFIEKGERFSSYLVDKGVLEKVSLKGLRNLINNLKNESNTFMVQSFMEYEGPRGRISDINAMDFCCKENEAKNDEVLNICWALDSYYSKLEDPYILLLDLIDSIEVVGHLDKEVYIYIILHFINFVVYDNLHGG